MRSKTLPVDGHLVRDADAATRAGRVRGLPRGLGGAAAPVPSHADAAATGSLRLEGCLRRSDGALGGPVRTGRTTSTSGTAGAYGWTAKRRDLYADDFGCPGSLVAVTARSNRSKADQDVAERMPPVEEARCQYLDERVSVDPAGRRGRGTGPSATGRSLPGRHPGRATRLTSHSSGPSSSTRSPRTIAVRVVRCAGRREARF